MNANVESLWIEETNKKCVIFLFVCLFWCKWTVFVQHSCERTLFQQFILSSVETLPLQYTNTKTDVRHKFNFQFTQTNKQTNKKTSNKFKNKHKFYSNRCIYFFSSINCYLCKYKEKKNINCTKSRLFRSIRAILSVLFARVTQTHSFIHCFSMEICSQHINSLMFKVIFR